MTNCIAMMSNPTSPNKLIEMTGSCGSPNLLNELEYDVYVVKASDTIESVAAHFQMTPSKLCNLNKLTMRTLLINQKLKVIKNQDTETDKLKSNTFADMLKPIQSEEADLFDSMSKSFNTEVELFPLHYKDNYIKVRVKYITDSEGMVNGKLLLTPVALTFIPAFKDPVIQEYGMDKFMIHLPNGKIACMSMYNNSHVMTYKRSQRTNDQILGHTHQGLDFQFQREIAGGLIVDDTETVHMRKLSLIKENSNEVVNLISPPNLENQIIKQSENKATDNQNHLKHMGDHNYLCVVASPRYRKTKVVYQKEDEYWFMVPVDSTEKVMDYILVNGETKYDVGANIDTKCTWPDDNIDIASSATSPVNYKSLMKSASFSKVDNYHIPDHDRAEHDSGFEFLREKSMDWEIINNDFDVNSFDDIFREAQLTESDIFDSEKVKELMDHMPSEAVGARWDLIYSTNRDGWSLQTLYRNVFDSTRNPCILVVKDAKSNIFGALCNTYIRLSTKFYGNGMTFLFRWSPNFQKFKYSEKNDYILYGDPKYFVVGSSNAKNGIRIQDTLYDGITQACDTFDSPPLVTSEFFQISTLEVWSFY